MFRIGTAACLLACLALAGPQLTLVGADGKKKSVTLVSCDAEGLVAEQAGRELRIPWERLAPRSAYDARKALTPYDDGAQRLELAEFAHRLHLYPEALEQLEIALALGGLDEAAFEKRAQAIEREEVDWLSAEIDRLLTSGAEPSRCLAGIRRLKERYPEHPANTRYEPEIERLVELLAEKAEADQAAKDEEAETRELAELRRGIEKLNRRKLDALAKADKLVGESKPAIEKRQVSRVKRKLVEPSGAERYYKMARRYLRAMARLDKHFRIVTREGLQREYDQIERKLLGCYLEVARILMKERNYKGAKEYVRKVLLYDPIHEEALEMVEEIRKNRISFKLSDITNARPRVTGG